MDLTQVKCNNVYYYTDISALNQNQVNHAIKICTKVYMIYFFLDAFSLKFIIKAITDETTDIIPTICTQHTQ